MSTLILLGGPPGVGKSTVMRLLGQRLEDIAFVDADDVWRLSPELSAEENREAARSNVAGAMRDHFARGCEVGVLSWVFARPQMYELITEALEDCVDRVEHIYLVASPEVIAGRLERRQDSHAIEYAKDRLRRIEALPYPRIDTSMRTPDEVADELASRIAKLARADSQTAERSTPWQEPT